LLQQITKTETDIRAEELSRIEPAHRPLGIG
jgi:hypothetical protein